MGDKQGNFTTDKETPPVGVMGQQKQVINAEAGHKSSPGSFIAVIVLIALVAVGGFVILRLPKTDQTSKPIEINLIPTTPESAEEPEATKPAAKKPVSATVTEVATPKNPDKIVEEFYDWYKGNPIPDESYKAHESLTSDLIKKIESLVSTLDYDPFLCSKETPSDYEVGSAYISGNDAGVIVDLNYSDGMKHAKVNLKLNGSWKMNNVACILENGVVGVLENLKMETGLDYVVLKNTDFYWTVPDYKGRKVKVIKGKGLSTDNADISQSAVQDFLAKNGFSTDSYNPTGYKKDDMVCEAAVTANDNGKYDVDVSCGKLITK